MKGKLIIEKEECSPFERLVNSIAIQSEKQFEKLFEGCIIGEGETDENK
jgi:hypothetical protein